jgi:tripartite-type tricarboxylate transporter receptor subunit TctC
MDPTVASVWEGKTLTVVVSQPPGGGTDSTARVVARHIGRFLPGNPNVIVQNMPGGGDRIAANFIYAARPDGLTIGLFDNGVMSYQLRGEGPEQGVRFDAAQFGWLGSPTVLGDSFLVHKRTGITGATVKQLETKEISMAQVSPGAASHVNQILLTAGLGWKIKGVFGYEGTAGRLLGIERGEVDSIVSSWDGQRRAALANIQNGTLVPVLVIGDRLNDPLLAGVPRASELFASRDAEAQQLLAFTAQPNEWGRPFSAPPKLEPKVLESLRTAFALTMADPQFLTDAQQIQLDVIPVTGEHLQQMITEYLRIPKSTVERLDKLIEADTPE